MQTLKCVVVGSGFVGKTCLILSYTTNAFPQYFGTMQDNHEIHVMFKGKPIQLCLWDTAGQTDYDRGRPLSYPKTDVFILCFAINSQQSFEELTTRFIPEIEFHCPATPYLIIGTKNDLRDPNSNWFNQHDEFVTTQDAQILCEEYDAYNKYEYIECSALTQNNLKMVFDKAIKAGLDHKTFNYSPPIRPFMMANAIDLKINRYRYNKYHIYHVHTFIFMIICIFMDTILTLMYIMNIIYNYDHLPVYHLYNIYISAPLAVICAFKYFAYSRHRWQYSPCKRLLFQFLFIILSFVLIPIIITCSTFSISSYILYHYVHIKFPLHNLHSNQNIYLDLFTFIQHQNKISNKKWSLLALVIINKELNKYGAIDTTDIDGVDDEFEFNVEALETIIMKQQFGDKSFIKYLFVNVYNTLLILDNTKDLELWWNKGNKLLIIFGAIFYFLLLPIHILSQSSRIIFSFYYHQYHFILDILFILLFLLSITLFFKFVLPFHCNIWKIGYNQNIKSIERNMAVLTNITKQYKYYCIIEIKVMLKTLFGTDIADIMCRFIFYA